VKGRTGKSTIRNRRLIAIALGLGLLVALPALALAHIERASYWPDPGPDTSVNPPAGGSVPAVRPLATALNKKGPGTTRIVCQQVPSKKVRKHGSVKRLSKNVSIKALNKGLKSARANGYKLRESQPAIPVGKKQAKKLRKVNIKLLRRCRYSSIQAAVNASGNNDRVEIMPGLYTEPASRAAPTHDPACADLVETNDHGTTGALSYKYQAKCPNDQNLIAVIGRAPTNTPVPQPPAVDRHGIPDAGPCIRCNLQIQGTGVSPDDVIIDGGNPSLGDRGAPGANPPDYSKDVGIRADRADGFVLDNLKIRHVNEHGIYVIETDGFNLDRFKTAYAKEYGVLTFVADHSIMHNCDAWGSGDAGLYPGAAADTWDAVPESQRRRSNVVADCDSHHNAAGYSGTDGNAVWIHNNNFYDNTLGFTTDVFTAPGHPGFPQDSDLIEDNNFYSNNFNLYLRPCNAGEKPGPYGPNQGCSDVFPTVPEPVGTGLWIAGGNHNIIRNNHFWDNWRRGVMIFAVPDQFVCGPAGVDPTLLAGCDPTKVPPSTSYNNEVYGNKMGVAPDGTKARNGVDFWWDSYASNTGNCWHDNTGVNGDRASLNTFPPLGPVAGQSLPGTLPEDCASSVGTGGPTQEAELLACFADFTFDVNSCDWFATPAKP
jgi:Right handed beta helix region